MIQGALRKPHFYQLLAISQEFGLQRVQAELEVIREGTETLSGTALQTLASLLGNIEIGFARAEARHRESLELATGKS